MTDSCPTLDIKKAAKVLGEIDKLVTAQHETLAQLESSFVRLSLLLYEAKRGAYWTLRDFNSEEEYIKSKFPNSRSQYYALIGIAEHLGKYESKKLESAGRSKCEDLVRIKKTEGDVPVLWWAHAEQDDKETFRRRVRDYMEKKTGKKGKSANPHEEDSLMTFRLFGDSITVVKKAFDILKLMTGSDKNAGDLLTLMCAEFLSQFDEERGRVTGQNAFLLSSIQGLVRQINFAEDKAADRLIGIIAAAVEGNTGTKE
jgi:hypothetical protein